MGSPRPGRLLARRALFGSRAVRRCQLATGAATTARAMHAPLIMRSLHRLILLGLSLLAPAAHGQTPASTSSPAPCYASLNAPLPTVSTPGLTTPSTPTLGAPAPAASTAAPAAGCGPPTSAAPSTVPPIAAPPQQNTLGGVTLQPSNPNLTVGGLPTSSP